MKIFNEIDDNLLKISTLIRRNNKETYTQNAEGVGHRKHDIQTIQSLVDRVEAQLVEAQITSEEEDSPLVAREYNEKIKERKKQVCFV